MRRAVVVVLDGVGVGELPDAAEYGDAGSNTLGNLARRMGGLKLPHLERLGLGNITAILGVSPCAEPLASYGRMGELSKGKDSTSGHWEIAGLILDRPFPTYPHGFPSEIIEPFEKAIGRGVLGNRPASGTAILEELGEEHLRTGQPIVYTSADSVFQIACHEEVVPVEMLYHFCEIARALLREPHNVARVIARPFVGQPGRFTRTHRRKDFSLPPPRKTLLDHLIAQGYPVVGIGKIEDLYAGQGVSEAIHTRDNMDGVDQLLSAERRVRNGLIMANLVQFDTAWGHRNDAIGFTRGLEDFDGRIPEIKDLLTDNDLLVITADHGCDPTTPSTDHAREYVPLLAYGPAYKRGVNLGTRQTFSDLGATISEMLGLATLEVGTSFYREIRIP